MSEVKVNALTRGKYPSRRGEGANGIIFKRILMDELMSGVNLFRPEEEVRGEEWCDNLCVRLLISINFLPKKDSPTHTREQGPKEWWRNPSSVLDVRHAKWLQKSAFKSPLIDGWAESPGPDAHMSNGNEILPSSCLPSPGTRPRLNIYLFWVSSLRRTVDGSRFLASLSPASGFSLSVSCLERIELQH